MPDAQNPNILETAADITAAWLANPNTKISADELPDAIRKIYGALSDLTNATPPAEPAEQYEPAVTVRRSLASKDHLISLIDGKPYKMLRRHLGQNGLTPEQYRERYGLKPDYPMVSENYAAKRRELAVKIGLGRKPAAGKTVPKAKAAKPAGTRGRKPATKPAAAASGTADQA